MKLTKEVREQLVGLLPMDNDAVHEYTPTLFESIPDKYKPIFYINQLNNKESNKIKEMMYLESMETGKKKNIAKSIEKKNEVYMEMLHNHLVGWDNLYKFVNNDEAEILEYDGKIETMMKLPEIVLTDLFTEIMRITGFLPKEIWD